MIENQNLRYKPANTLSQDEKGKTSQDTSFRGSNLLTPISVKLEAIPIPAQGWRTALYIYNGGTGPIYLGDDTVTAVNGIPVAAGASFVVTVGHALTVYAISESAGGETVRAWELG